MDENARIPREDVSEEPARNQQGKGWLAVGIVILLVIAAFAVAYGFRQQNLAAQLSSHEAHLNATITEMQGQINSLTARLNQTPPQPAVSPSANSGQPDEAALAARRRAAAQNKRLKQMESQLSDQQQQLKDTQNALDQAKSDFSASLGSTRDELNGSIAHTHDELVALEQKGERNYFEFDLTRSKSFQHAGPIQISLRHADPKHKTFDLAMVVDDNVLSKKRVDLYEPIWISGSDSQPLQIVVNNISKDKVHGYVSAPKYAQPRVLPASAGKSAGEKPAPDSSPNSTPQANPTSNPQ